MLRTLKQRQFLITSQCLSNIFNKPWLVATSRLFGCWTGSIKNCISALCLLKNVKQNNQVIVLFKIYLPIIA